MESNNEKSLNAQNFVESMFARESCYWCKAPNGGIYGKSLCSDCYRLNRNLGKWETQAAKDRDELLKPSLETDFELKTVRQAIVNAKKEGTRYGKLGEREIDGSILEKELKFLSEIVAGKNLYHADANLFNECLSLPQRRFVLYILSEMSRVRLKKSRKSRAQGDVILKRVPD